MKIAKAIIENFRHIERLELDFTDSLGRVRDVSVIVGPNTSGKTTVLDALAAGLGYITEFHYIRPGFTLTPRDIVRRGQLQAKVTYHIHFSQDEIDATRELFRLSEEKAVVPELTEIELLWKYPDLKGTLPRGWTRAEPEPGSSWRLFKGRNKAARLLATGRVDPSWFERVGGIFTFDQQRTGMGKTIRRDIWEIMRGNGVEGEDGERYTTDPKQILLSLAIDSLIPSINQQPDQFKRIREHYARICAPHEIKGAVRDELNQYDLIFTNGLYEYRYGGLSSGEQMLLLFLIRMVTEYINQSIVLIDEIELHQHPLWQRKLLYLLPKIGRNNQIIVTTHSAHLRDVIPREAVIDLGHLGDTIKAGMQD